MAELARTLSRSGPVAWLNLELFGGTGLRASMAWTSGAVVLGLLVEDADIGPHRPAPASGPDPVQVALRTLGVDSGSAADEFAALDLGRHRHTDRWTEELT